MNLLFVSANRLKRPMPPMPLGLASIIGQIDESRHEVRVSDLMFSEHPEEELTSVISEFGPDVIAVSLRNLDNQSYLHTEYLIPEARRLIELCREQSSATIVVGGPAFTVSPIAIFEYVMPDLGIVGEGELVFRELVERLEEKRDCSHLTGLVWRGPDGVCMNPPGFIEDLDSLRLPRRDLFDNRRYAAEGGFANIVIKQGCTFRCLYCDSPHRMGSRWRMKSPQRVADELESMQKEIGVNVAFFTDAIFNVPPEHAKEVCREIIRRQLKMFWIASIHPAFADRELIKLMRDAGCNALSVGCDTCSERMLKVLRKDFTKEHLRATIDMVEEMEIQYILSLLIGGPGEDRQTVEETVDFLKDRSPFMVDVCAGIRLMPHTELFDIAVEDGVISADDPLMEPKFYISSHIKDWIEGYLMDVCSRRPNWTISRIEP